MAKTTKAKVRHSYTYKGRRLDIRGNSEREVMEKYLKKCAEIDAGLEKQSQAAKFGEYAVFVFETYRRPKVKEITYDRYIRRLNYCIIRKIGKMKVVDIKRIHLQQLLNEMEGQSKYQINQVKQMLTFIFNQAKLDGIIAINPAEGLISPKGTKTTNRAFTDEEEAAFLECCHGNPRFRVFLLSYYCGCRPDEARGIIGSDIHLIDGVPMLHIRGTKTLSSDRIVPLDYSLYQQIKDTPADKPAAPNLHGKRQNECSYYQGWKALKAEMNISLGAEVMNGKPVPPLPLAEDICPYTLRHTFATNLLKHSVDIRTAQHLLGHADITMTANVYTHVDTNEVKKAAELMGCGA